MTKITMQPPVCAPNVNEFMLNADYWIEKTPDTKKLILNEEEIVNFNKKSFSKMKSIGFQEWLYDLEIYPKRLPGSPC